MTIVVLAFTFLSAALSVVAGFVAFIFGDLLSQVLYTQAGIWVDQRLLAIIIGILTFIILEWAVLSDIVKS